MENVNIKQSKSSYNYALSQIFSSSLLKKINNPIDELSLKSLITACNLYPPEEDWNLMKGLEITYRYLRTNYRCEYIYKNEIANQILLKYHNDNSATLLKEVNSNSCIADIVIINGSTVAYEIKTELDSFERLANQIESYQVLYDYLNIVTYPKAAKALLAKLPINIGVIVLDDDGVLRTERRASNNSEVFNALKAVYTLRQAELVTAYEIYVGKIPKMGTALIHSFCYDWYVKLDKIDAHLIFYNALKSRKPSDHQFELIKHCNPILKMLFLGKDFSRKYCISTLNILNTFGDINH